MSAAHAGGGRRGLPPASRGRMPGLIGRGARALFGPPVEGPPDMAAASTPAAVEVCRRLNAGGLNAAMSSRPGWGARALFGPPQRRRPQRAALGAAARPPRHAFLRGARRPPPMHSFRGPAAAAPLKLYKCGGPIDVRRLFRGPAAAAPLKHCYSRRDCGSCHAFHASRRGPIAAAAASPAEGFGL